MRSSHPRVEDIGELMHHIQSRLPVKEAARTSVLSKSWLHAWSTIPTLRFHVREKKHLNVVDGTLNRYLSDNLPIERFELDIRIENVESASLAEQWLRSVATKTCSLKELSLSVTLTGASLTFPNEILSVAENLTKLRVSTALRQGPVHSIWMRTPINSRINCVSLREVVLRGVRISQDDVLDDIFSSCSLLENIDIYLDKQEGRGRDAIKIKNLARLHKIRIYSEDGDSTDLEISGVPNLRLFRCVLYFGEYERPARPLSAYSISLGSSVSELWLGGLITDKSSLEMIESGFPFLEIMTLDIRWWTLEIFHFTCASLKKLSLMWPPSDRLILIDIQVFAPKLFDFFFIGYSLPTLLFPVSILVQTTFKLTLNMALDASFFLNLRDALKLSTKCDLHVITNYEPRISDIDLDDLRTRLPLLPSTNVQRLEFQAVYEDECCSPFFDAFFEICHPKHVFANPNVISQHTNHFFELMVREVLEKKKMKTTRRSSYWHSYLKHVQIRGRHKWETLRNSHRTFLDGGGPIHFKLNWR